MIRSQAQIPARRNHRWTGAIALVILELGGIGALLVMYVLMRGRDAGGWARFFLGAGLLSALLGIDDLLLLHEEVFTRVFRVREQTVFGIYMLLVLAFILRFVGKLRETAHPLLIFSLGFFIVSLAVDRGTTQVGRPYHHLVEDGAKFMGVTNWCAFFVHTAWKRLRPMVSATATAA